ncbi:hypothetical protein [Ktedonospora formicarum]|uniref:Uncharacterized protein n=1 Tax=Ktedonospora formicarum TaxID=2778364 RepID=A0A8J3I8H3_9CHLR|nr:hypothetical protein [Ktedonospora formicarum]GHO51434.1 hypothetical protein KSX_95970 [Ktedonospora formicarum]
MADLLFEGNDSRSHPPSDAHTAMPSPATGDASVDPPGIVTLSVATDTFERVDPRTLQIFQDLFPGEHGVQFLAKLLRHAQVKQLVLPQLGISTVADVAVISAQSLRALARLMDFGYDTLEKYIVTLSQLKLVHKQRARRQIVLHFPLSASQLPDPDALDHLGEYRHKVALFARQVKRRYLKLRASKKGDFYAVRSSSVSSEPLVLVPASATVDTAPLTSQVLDLILEDFDQVLSTEPIVDSKTKSRLLARMEDALHMRCARLERQLSSQKGDFSENRKDTLPSPQKRESPFLSQKDDSLSSQTPLIEKESRLSHKKGDSLNEGLPMVPIRKRQLSSPKDDFNTDVVEQKGDSDAHKRQLSLEKGDSLSPKGDLEASFVNGDLANVNVITFFNKITLNVSIGSHFFCQAFGEKPTKRNIYRKVFQDVNQDTQAILGAYLVTLAHQHDGTIKNLAGFFLARCKTFHQELSDEAQQLITHYSAYTYAQVQEALSHSQPVVPAPGTQPSSLQTSSAPPSHVRTGPRPPSVTIRVPVQSGGGMDLQTAERLRRTISADQRMLFIPHVRRLLLRDGSYAVFVGTDDFQKIRQVLLYSEEEWLANSTTMTSGMQLFSKYQKEK